MRRLLLFLNQVAAREAMRGAKPVVSVILVDDDYIADLNQRFKSRAGPTDVLAFDDPDYPEVYVCIQEAGRRGPVDLETARLALHGTLHLMGYDHHQTEDAVLMQAKEQEYIELWV